MSDHESQTNEPAVSDVVRACIRMTGAGVAIAVLPYALFTGMVAGGAWLYDDRALGDDDVTGVARVVLLCTLVAAAGVLALGIRAAWAVRHMPGGGPRPWLAVVAATLALWCWPPFWFFTTPWMFVGATLAVRPLWWSHRVWGEVSADDARDHLRVALGLTAAITVLSHVMAWLLVFATAFVVPPEEFARVEAMRSAADLHAREAAREPKEATSGDIDFIEMITTAGAVAAGRYVGGDMSQSQFSLGPWAEIAQAWIAPGTQGVSYADSWWIAAVAFLLSLAFWTPLMLAWTWRGAHDARRLRASARAPSA